MRYTLEKKKIIAFKPNNVDVRRYYDKIGVAILSIALISLFANIFEIILELIINDYDLLF